MLDRSQCPGRGPVHGLGHLRGRHRRDRLRSRHHRCARHPGLDRRRRLFVRGARLQDDRLPGVRVGVTLAAGQRGCRGDLPDHPGGAGDRPRLGHRPLFEPGRHLAHRQLADHHRERPGNGRSTQRCRRPGHRVGLGHQPAPDRRRRGAEHPLLVRHHLQPGHLADRSGDRCRRLRARCHRCGGHLCDPRVADHGQHRLCPPIGNRGARLDHGAATTAGSHLPGAHDHAAAPESGQSGHGRRMGGGGLEHVDGDRRPGSTPPSMSATEELR